MKNISFASVANTRHSLLLATFLGALTLSSCATSDSASQPSPAASEKPGAVSAVRTYEQNGRVVVVGRARPPLRSSANHVDVELIDRDGRVVAAKTEALELGHPRGSRARNGSKAFVASFSVEAARPATSVRVSFHNGTRATCIREQG